MEYGLCFSRALTLAVELRDCANALDASEEDQRQIYRVALSAMPMMLWHLDCGDFKREPSSMWELAELSNGAVGLAAASLLRRDIPEPICRALYPALRPDRHESVVRWWDDIALQAWVRPYFEFLGERGLFEAAVGRPAQGDDSAEQDMSEWAIEHMRVWRPR